ncbi:metallophosphoesterase family protein [Metaclostridioides mangenotii]|uniref:metallophosphoesterase family protein n=1 Tax=Metaclostridioides mangenotii TaxID=1540 RepID=UPI00046481BB|nr:exonuclease subunit SbcD [Clostridioides mangenotii]
MRFIHTSDWHLGKTLEGHSRIDEQEKFCEDFIELVDEKNIDLVIIAGDIYDTYNPSAQAERLFYKTVSRLADNGRRCVFIISGNHDNPDRLSAAVPLALEQGIIILGKPNSSAELGEYKKFKIIEAKEGCTKLNINGEDVTILSLPYPSEKRLNDLIEDNDTEEKRQSSYSEKVGNIFRELEKNFDEESINIAVSHIFITGGDSSDSERPIQLGGSLLVEKKDLPDRADYIALGHLHKPQKASEYFSAYYSGSPLQYSKSERVYAKGANIVDIHVGEDAVIEKVYFKNYKPIEVFKCNGVEEAIKICEENKDRDIWSFFEITTDEVIDQSDLKTMKELLKDIIEIKPIINTIETKAEIDLKEKSMGELFKEFYVFSKGVEPKGELMDLFMDIIYEEGEI